MKCRDIYKEVKVICFENMIARVHIPELTAEEKVKRMKAIHTAAENLLRKGA